MNSFQDKTYAQSIAYVADKYRESIALTFGDRDYTFRDIKTEADRASARFAALGVKPGEKVGIWVPNRPEFAWCWLGAAQMGAVPVVMNTRLRRAEFEYQIAQSDSVVVVIPGPGAFRDFLEELIEACPQIRSGQMPAASFPKLRRVVVLDPLQDPEKWDNVTEWNAIKEGSVPSYADDPNSAALIAYSSGTTSLPKGAMLSHCIWRKAYDGGRLLDLTPDDRLYLSVPLFGVLGCLNGLLSFWTHGCRIFLRERFDAGDFIRTVAVQGCTLAHLLPAMIDRVEAHPDYDKAAFRTLRGGVLLSSRPDHMQRAISVLDAPGYTTGYGLTESTGLVTRSPWNGPIEDRLSHQGWPLPSCDIRIVDPDTLADLPNGDEGEILIGGYSVMLGYYNKPEETANAIRNGWLHSGDLGRRNDDGSLQFLRRVKDGYKHKGFNVSTPEVEASILKFPGIAAAAVVGVPDAKFGEKGVAFVVPIQNRKADITKLAEFLGTQLASFKLPGEIFVIDEFPLTGGTEKVMKFKLREMAMQRLGISA